MGHRLSFRLTHLWSRPGIQMSSLPPETEGSFLTSSPLTTTQQVFCFVLFLLLLYSQLHVVDGSAWLWSRRRDFFSLMRNCIKYRDIPGTCGSDAEIQKGYSKHLGGEETDSGSFQMNIEQAALASFILWVCAGADC